MKKIIFCLNNLDYGGIETAFVNLSNLLDYEKYDVTLFLEKKEGVFLNNLNPNIKIIDYNLANSKNIFKRKIINRFKLTKFIILNYHKYDFSACFASSRKVGSIVSRYLSSNNCLWIHGNYYETKEEGIKFLNYIKASKFKKIVFVSNQLKNKYLSINNSNQLLYVFNNIINYNRIIELSEKEKIENNKLTFVHIGRHKEDEKNILMLLSVIKRLSLDNLDFVVYLIGDGVDHELYKKKVLELGISSYVIFTGSKSNPYPYLKNSDALLLTSLKEGNPVVFLEAKVLNIPIITTDVSDSKIDILNKYGLVSELNEESFYLTVKKFIEDGFVIKNKFNPEEYNQDILKKLDKVIGD